MIPPDKMCPVCRKSNENCKGTEDALARLYNQSCFFQFDASRAGSKEVLGVLVDKSKDVLTKAESIVGEIKVSHSIFNYYRDLIKKGHAKILKLFNNYF